QHRRHHADPGDLEALQGSDPDHADVPPRLPPALARQEARGVGRSQAGPRAPGSLRAGAAPEILMPISDRAGDPWDRELRRNGRQLLWMARGSFAFVGTLPWWLPVARAHLPMGPVGQFLDLL